MSILQRCLRVSGLGSLLFVVGCGASPTAPTPVDVPVPGATAASVGAGDTAAPRCEPTFLKQQATHEDFFILTVNFPSGCQWFAIDNEPGVNYWELTAPDYSLRNRQKFLRGFVGVGVQKLGVHFIRKIGYLNYRTLVLDVCSGSSCGPTSQRWTWTYTAQ